MFHNRSQYYTRYEQRYITEYCEAAPTYRENNHQEINGRDRNVRYRDIKLSRLHNKNEYSGEVLSNNTPPLSIG